jgi:hypothetical protein
VKIPDDLNTVVKDIREELDEHLDALNQNTAEIAATHEYVSEMDMKLEKLAERVDALQALLLAQTPGKSLRLNPKEEDVYRILVESSEPVTSMIIGKQAGLTADLAAQTLYIMKQKGVPILAQIVGEQTFYALDARFKIEIAHR